MVQNITSFSKYTEELIFNFSVTEKSCKITHVMSIHELCHLNLFLNVFFISILFYLFIKNINYEARIVHSLMCSEALYNKVSQIR